MRHFSAMLMLMASASLLSQDNCDPFNIQGLAAENLSQQAEIDALSCYAGVEMDGYRYKGVPIGDQCWFAENLRTNVYADGSSIPKVTDAGVWVGLSTGARLYFANEPVLRYEYGQLYNWYAVDDARGLCPSGWHVPTDEEWTALETYLSSNGHSGNEGTALRTTTGWYSGVTGTDDVGFAALPGGNRADNGSYYNVGYRGFWWTSSPTGGNAWARNLFHTNPSINRDTRGLTPGFSVRCLRDAE
jgi:uncharacterized protein (TIGR02145 family)